jgi:flagellar biosynthesis/type III secretory pathway protein FliH
MDQITRDEKLLHAYEMYEMTLSDETSRLNGAREEGEAKGREEGEAIGIAKGREEGQKTILELMRQGYTAEQIEAMLSKAGGEER